MFDICKCLLQDPMHVFFEGICHLELKSLLEYSINNKNKLFLAYLNDKITNFNYNKHDKPDKPNEIDVNLIKNGFFTQTSAQMSVLYHNLPQMIGDRYENNDKYWANFLSLLKIINLTFAFNYNEKTIENLRKEIRKFLENFIILNPNVNLTPKMHYLTHFPSQMREFGNPRHHSAIRFELKNGHVKSYTYKNFKNITKSVAYRQEYWMVSRYYDCDWENADNFLNKGDSAGKAQTDHDIELFTNYKLPENAIVFSCSSIRVNGFNYEIGAFIIINEKIIKNKSSIGRIKKIYILNNEFVFKIELYDIISFMNNINCLECKKNEKTSFRFQKNLLHQQPLIETVIKDDDLYLVSIRYYFEILDSI